jgi:hypothetical protein
LPRLLPLLKRITRICNMNYEPLDYRLRCHTKRKDLPADVICDMADAYAEIIRLTRERDEARRVACAEYVRKHSCAATTSEQEERLKHEFSNLYPWS